MNKIAYLKKSSTGYTITICDRPCNGAEFNDGEKVAVISKADARKVCASRSITPHNF